MLVVHHLGVSQSERIVWLCEELEIPYELRRYERDPITRLAPADYKAIHPTGSAPVITDGELVLAESGAIVDYIVAKYGQGRLTIRLDSTDFANFLYWVHFANGTLQSGVGRLMMLNRLSLAKNNAILSTAKARVDRILEMIEARTAAASYLAGDTFTTADIMSVFTLTTMRYFQPLDLSAYPNIIKYLARVGRRPAYIRAMEKGDPGRALLLS